MNNGIIRTITANTAGALTVAALPSAPGTGDTYVIEGSEDYLYLMGNNAVTLYRYTISTNTWTTLSPVSARAGIPGQSAGFLHVDGVPDSDWNDGTYGALNSAGTIRKQNGRYIYSFRANNTNALDVYDIAANTWIALPYGNQSDLLNLGCHYAISDGVIYICRGGNMLAFDVAKNILEGYTYHTYPSGGIVTGNRLFVRKYKDGGEVKWLYTALHSRVDLVRWAMI